MNYQIFYHGLYQARYQIMYFNLFALLAFNLLLLSPASLAQSHLSDTQIKTVRQSSQAILRSRLNQKEARMAASQPAREQLMVLRNIVTDLEHQLLSRQMKVEFHSTTSVSNGQFKIAEQRQQQLKFDPASREIISINKIQPGSKLESSAAPVQAVVAQQTAATKSEHPNSLNMDAHQATLARLKSRLTNQITQQKPGIMSRIRRFLGLQQVSKKSLTMDPQDALLKLVGETETLMQAVKNQNNNLLAMTKDLKQRMQLNQSASQLPEVEPTIATRTRHRPH